MKKFVIPPAIKEKLKTPLGQLIPDSQVKKQLLGPFFSSNNLTVSVGDRTTERIHELGFTPFLEIVDSLEKRISRSPPLWSGQKDRLLKAENPPGSISSNALNTLKTCLKLKQLGADHIRIEIEGEEDLLALPVIAFFPTGTVTFYGQPNEGMVIVSSTEIKTTCRQFLQEIGILSLD